MEDIYNGIERREFIRLDYAMPLKYKVCNKQTISKLLEGHTSDISQAGLLCNIKGKVEKDDILWLSFNRSILSFCEELEKRALIYQQGVIGKAVRIRPKDFDTYEVGIKFITWEEKNPVSII